MKHLGPALRLKIFMTILLGLVYPLTMTGLAQGLFHASANGQLISRGGQIVGAELIGQKFERPEYFWSRPSAVDYNPLSSGGSNLGQTSADLKKAFDERLAKLKASHPDQTVEPPQDLLFASGSGLDPQISLEAALYQRSRIAKARKMSEGDVQAKIDSHAEPRALGILGEPTVNVLALNLDLDQAQGITAAPAAAAVPAPLPAPAATAK